jgi:hypothetical protein
MVQTSLSPEQQRHDHGRPLVGEGTERTLADDGREGSQDPPRRQDQLGGVSHEGGFALDVRIRVW